MIYPLINNPSIYSDKLVLKGEDAPGLTFETIEATVGTLYLGNDKVIWNKLTKGEGLDKWDTVSNYNHINNLIYSEQFSGNINLVVEGLPIKYIQNTLAPITNPTYTLSRLGLSTVEEGSYIGVLVNTTNIEDGKNISYVITGTNINTSDMSLTGSVQIYNNSGNIGHYIERDFNTEGDETFTLTLMNKSLDFTILDTSKTLTYNITYNPIPILNFSNPITVTIIDGYPNCRVTIPDPNYYWYPYALGYTNSEGNVTFTFDITANTVITNLVIEFNYGQVTKPLVLTAIPMPITYTLYNSYGSSWEEGKSYLLEIKTTGLAVGTVIPYTISGVTSADINNTSLTGTVTVQRNNIDNREVLIPISQDYMEVNDKILTFTLDNTGTTISIPITSVFPTYSFSTNKVNNTISENETIIVTLTTTGLLNGTIVPYDITGVNINSYDIDKSLYGSFVINNNTATLSIKALLNELAEGTETMSIKVANGQGTNIIILNTVPTYSLSTNKVNNTISENETIIVTLATTGLLNGSLVPYEITGVTQEDIDKPMVGNFTINNNIATLSIKAILNDITEGTETIILTLGTGQAITINVLNIVPTYSLSVSGQTNPILDNYSEFRVKVLTTNVPNGTIPFTFSGLATDELDESSLTGLITINNGIGNTNYYYPTIENLYIGQERIITFTLDGTAASISLTINGVD